MITAAKRPYRATFVLDTRKYEGAIEDLTSKLSEVVTSVGGESISTDDTGTRNFVRQSRKGADSGRFVILTFDASPEAPTQIQDKVRLDRTVNRVLVEVLSGR